MLARTAQDRKWMHLALLCVHFHEFGYAPFCLKRSNDITLHMLYLKVHGRVVLGGVSKYGNCKFNLTLGDSTPLITTREPSSD